MTHDARSYLFGAAFSLLAVIALAAKGNAAQQYPIPGHGTLELDIPATMDSMLEQPEDGGPPAIALRPKQGDEYGAMVIVSWRQPNEADFGSDTYLERVLRENSKPYLEQLGIAEVPIARVTGGKSPGYACSLTDASAVGKPREPGNYPYMRQGVVTTGDLLLAYTIFMYTQEPDPVPALERIFMNARQVSGGKMKR